MTELSPRERIVLAIDSSEAFEAERLVRIAKKAGARFIKFGLEIQSITSWQYCASVAESARMDWIADAKVDDIPNTMRATVDNISSRYRRPFGITVHAKAGIESMRAAQEVARESIIFGVTELTSIPEHETADRYGIPRSELVKRLAYDIADVGLRGVVTSPRDIASIKADDRTKDLFSLVPGIRSSIVSGDDQSNVDTPLEAIKHGSDLIVMGREITKADDPYDAFERTVEEIEKGIAIQAALETQRSIVTTQTFTGAIDIIHRQDY